MTQATLAAALADAGIRLRRYTTGTYRTSCPRCNRRSRDDALGVTIADDAAIWNCFRCGWAGAWRPRDPVPTRPTKAMPRPQPALSDKRRWSPHANGIWERATAIPGTPVEIYLRGRGCAVPADLDLRFHRNIGGHPAMVARVTDAATGEPMTLHFTLLKPDGCGKADVERPKLLLKDHTKAGGVIRLVPDADVTLGLGIAEGIETALSVMASGWSPVWAAIDAGNVAAFPVLAGIESLTIFADHDDAGLSAARRCLGRWHAAGREACIVAPPGTGNDWNDTTRRTAA